MYCKINDVSQTVKDARGFFFYHRFPPALSFWRDPAKYQMAGRPVFNGERLYGVGLTQVPAAQDRISENERTVWQCNLQLCSGKIPLA